MGQLGIDIGTSSIKVVDLARDGKAWRLIAAGIVPTPAPGIINATGEKDLVAIADQIKKLLHDAKISDRNVIFALPESNVYTRIVSFPPLTDAEVGSAVGWQIEGYIPISKKDAVYDHQIVQRTEKGVEVLIIAVPRVFVMKYMKVAQLAGLKELSIETELLSLSRSIVPPGKRCVVIDFGATSTDIAIVVNGQVKLSRSISTAGQALTRAVAQGIGVESRQAEEYKKTYGLTDESLEGKVKDALDPVISVVVDEIKKALGFWREEHPDVGIEMVIVSGGTSILPSFTPKLTQAISLEVTIGNPFANIKMDPQNAKNISPVAPLYAIAVGLAMWEK